MEQIWTCKIGGDIADLPDGADWPLNQAVAKAYKKLTGIDAEFKFTGWGGTLDEHERLALIPREERGL